jgi:hypothetical protein
VNQPGDSPSAATPPKRRSAGRRRRRRILIFSPLGALDEIKQVFNRNKSAKPTHAKRLREMTKAVETAKDPGMEAALVEHLNAHLDDLSASIVCNAIHSSKRCRAQLTCAATALAIERYRLKYRNWPASINDVIAVQILPDAPIDPYDGMPQRYRRTKDGVVVYSVGPTGRDRGDALDREGPIINDERLEFRLWNPASRSR